MVRISNRATLDATIDGVYGSIQHPEEWAGVLRNIDNFTKSSCTILLCPQNNRTSYYNIPTTIDEFRIKHYQDTLLFKDNVVDHVRGLAPGQVVTSTDFLGSEGARRSTVYREFYAECGFLHFIGANLLLSDNEWIGIVSFRGPEEPPYGTDDRELLQQIVPHMVRSTNIAQYILERQPETNMVMSGFEATHHAAFLLDPEGRVVTMNGLGRALVDEGAMGLSVDQKLGLPCDLPSKGGNVRGPLGQTSWTVHAPTGRKLAVSVSQAPSSPGAPRTGHAQTGSQLVLVFDLDAHFSAIVEDIRREYGLTGAERRVYEASIHHSSSCEIADALHLGRETVRTHLKNIFLKIEVSGHVDLVQNFNQRLHAHLGCRRMT